MFGILVTTMKIKIRNFFFGRRFNLFTQIINHKVIENWYTYTFVIPFRNPLLHFFIKNCEKTGVGWGLFRHEYKLDHAVDYSHFGIALTPSTESKYKY